MYNLGAQVHVVYRRFDIGVFSSAKEEWCLFGLCSPAWLSKYFAKESNRSYWVVPMGHVLLRLHDLRGAPIRRQLKRTPLAIAATALDLLVAVSANREIKHNQGSGFC